MKEEKIKVAILVVKSQIWRVFNSTFNVVKSFHWLCCLGFYFARGLQSSESPSSAPEDYWNNLLRVDWESDSEDYSSSYVGADLWLYYS